MKTLILFLFTILSINWTSAQQANATINGTPGPFIFNGSGVTQTGQTFTFSSSGGGDTITSPNSTLTVGGTAGATTLDFNLAHANTWTGTQTGTFVLSGVSTGTSPVCPNGSGGALTTSGCSGGGSSTTLQTNGSNNTSQAAINFITSTVDATGLVITPSNPATSSEVFEISGSLDLSSLAIQAANTLLANITASSASPAAVTIPAGISFYTLGTGFSAATATNVGNLFGCGGSATTFLNGAGGCTSPTGSGTVNSATANQLAIYSTTGTAVSGDTLFTDNGTTLAYTGTGGISAPSIIASNPSGGVGSNFFMTQEGTVPASLSAAGQDNCYASSAQHGILCNFNAGTTEPLFQGPASNTNGDLVSFSGTNGGQGADSGILATNVVTLAGTQTLTNKSISGSQINSGSVVIANGGTGQTTAAAALAALLAGPAAGTYTVVCSSSSSCAPSTALVANTTVTVAGSVAFTANTCSSVSGTSGTASTVSMTNLATTMTAEFTPNSDVHAVVGWSPASGGQLYFTAWPSAAGTLSYYVCNGTASTITTGSSVTFNVSAK